MKIFILFVLVGLSLAQDPDKSEYCKGKGIEPSDACLPDTIPKALKTVPNLLECICKEIQSDECDKARAEFVDTLYCANCAVKNALGTDLVKQVAGGDKEGIKELFNEILKLVKKLKLCPVVVGPVVPGGGGLL